VVTNNETKSTLLGETQRNSLQIRHHDRYYYDDYVYYHHVAELRDIQSIYRHRFVNAIRSTDVFARIEGDIEIDGMELVKHMERFLIS